MFIWNFFLIVDVVHLGKIVRLNFGTPVYMVKSGTVNYLILARWWLTAIDFWPPLAETHTTQHLREAVYEYASRRLSGVRYNMYVLNA